MYSRTRRLRDTFSRLNHSVYNDLNATDASCIWPAHICSIAQQAAQLPHLHPPRLSGLIHLSRWLQVQMHPFGLACIDREAEVGVHC